MLSLHTSEARKWIGDVKEQMTSSLASASSQMHRFPFSSFYSIVNPSRIQVIRVICLIPFSKIYIDIHLIVDFCCSCCCCCRI